MSGRQAQEPNVPAGTVAGEPVAAEPKSVNLHAAQTESAHPESANPESAKPESANSESAESESAKPGKGNYEIGYGRPPKRTRFKPGESGNKKGRPKGHANVKTTLARIANEKVNVVEGKKKRRLTKFEAMCQAQLSKAMQGDSRAANAVSAMLAKVGLLGEQEEIVHKRLSADDEAILADFVRRRTTPPDDDPTAAGEPQ